LIFFTQMEFFDRTGWGCMATTSFLKNPILFRRTGLKNQSRSCLLATMVTQPNYWPVA
jgi:hypothetical protein